MTNFIIYNSSCYDNMLRYSFDNHIDQYISLKFTQIYPNDFITTQYPSFSDIIQKDIDNSDIIKHHENMLKNIEAIDK